MQTVNFNPKTEAQLLKLMKFVWPKKEFTKYSIDWRILWDQLHVDNPEGDLFIYWGNKVEAIQAAGTILMSQLNRKFIKAGKKKSAVNPKPRSGWRRFECTSGKFYKFWSIKRHGYGEVETKFGAIGYKGSTNHKWGVDKKQYDKLVESKLRKGYVEVT